MSESTENRRFRLMPSPENPANIRTKHCEKLESLGYIFAVIIWVYLHSNFHCVLKYARFVQWSA